jgi:Metallo-beta-lactamase superfamily
LYSICNSASQPLLCRDSESASQRWAGGLGYRGCGGASYNGGMIIETFPVGPLQCNCTILGDEQAGEAIVIDPGDEVGRIHRRLTELGLKLKQILVTHGHIDHIGGALKLKRLTGAPILLNEADLPQLKMMDAQAGWLGVATPETAPPDESLSDGAHAGVGVLAFCSAQAAGCGRYAVCRKHWADRSARRRLRADYRLHRHAPAGSAGRDAGRPGPRGSYIDRS